MNDESINDLKQFITAPISQQTTDLRQVLEGLQVQFVALDQNLTLLDHKVIMLDLKLTQIDHKVDDLTLFVTDALDISNDIYGDQLRDHDKRITVLEQAAAA